MSAPKRLFIFYNSFSSLLTENLHEQKHFLKAFNTCFVYIIFLCKMYNKKLLFTAIDGRSTYTNQIGKCKTVDSFYHTTINMVILMYIIFSFLYECLRVDVHVSTSITVHYHICYLSCMILWLINFDHH